MITTDAIAELDVDIRRVVVLLNEHKFLTIDSGDGHSKPDDGCRLPYAHVMVAVDDRLALVDMLCEARRMFSVLRSFDAPHQWQVEAIYNVEDNSMLLCASLDGPRHEVSA